MLFYRYADKQSRSFLMKTEDMIRGGIKKSRVQSDSAIEFGKAYKDKNRHCKHAKRLLSTWRAYHS